MLGSIDTTMLEEMCVWHFQYEKSIKADDTMTAARCFDRFAKIAREFGMSPDDDGVRLSTETVGT